MTYFPQNYIALFLVGVGGGGVEGRGGKGQKFRIMDTPLKVGSPQFELLKKTLRYQLYNIVVLSLIFGASQFYFNTIQGHCTWLLKEVLSGLLIMWSTFTSIRQSKHSYLGSKNYTPCSSKVLSPDKNALLGQLG